MASIGDVFLRMLADDSGFKADLIKKGVKAGDAAGLTMGQRMAGSLGKSLNKNLGKGVSNAVNNIGKIAVSAGVLAVGGGAAALKWAGDFEAQLNTINTIARETPEGLAKIGDEIRAIARETGTPLEELTQGYYDLLSAGIKAADAPKVLQEANKLAIGGLASAAETVDLLTTAINVYGGDASQAGRFTDEFAKAIERGKVTAAELASSYAQVAPLAKSLGIENKELAAGYATLTAAGTPAAEASTQMAASLTALLKKTPALEKLEKQTGNNYAAIAGSKGLNVALEQMRTDADKAGLELVDLVGRKEALLYILQTTGPNLQRYNADLEAMGDAAGTAADQMSERQKGLNFQLNRAKALFKDAGITIGTALMPKLIPLIEKFNEFISGNQEGIKRFGTDLADAFEGIAQWIVKLDFKSIVESLKLAGGFARGIISAFLAAPQWLQAAVVTGWGLNKLTGGMVSSILGDLTKTALTGFLQQFIARGSSPANPMFVSGVGIGGADVLGTVGKGGLLASILRLLPATAIAAAIVSAAVPIGEAFASFLPDEFKGEGGKGMSESQTRILAARAAEEAARYHAPVDMSPEARQARSDLHAMAQTALEEHRRGERGMEREADQLESIDSNLTALQQQMHTDLATAIATLESSNDPAALTAAVDAIVKSVLGGAGSGKTTADLVTRLKTELAAAEAANNKPLADQIKAAIAQLEPFAKGRQWQSEQLAKAQSVVDSNKSTADKVAALRTIQSDLLSHQRTMAAGIIAKQIDTITAIKGIKINASTGFSTTGPYSEPKPGPKPPKGKTPVVSESTGFVLRARGGPLSAYQTALLGEEGPELWRPRVAGQVYSAQQTRDMLSSGGDTINMPISVQGLLRARNPFELVEQAKRVKDFLVATPRREPV